MIRESPLRVVGLRLFQRTDENVAGSGLGRATLLGDIWDGLRAFGEDADSRAVSVLSEGVGYRVLDAVDGCQVRLPDLFG